MTQPVHLDGERIRLRPVVADDAAGPYLGWMNDPEVTRFLESRFSSYSEDDLRRYIAAVQADHRNHFFAIELADEGRHVGNIKLGPVEEHHRRGDIGIIVGARDCWGRGIATEAISLVAEWAFASLGLEKLTAGAYAPNIGSVRAFERAGFTVEAVLLRHYVSAGRRIDGVLMARFAPGAAGAQDL